MKKLFKVKTMPNYKYHYVMADDFNQAQQKVLNFLKETETFKSLFDNDGSLRTNNKDLELFIEGIELITDEIIY